MKYATGQRSARIVYLMPDSSLGEPYVTELLETLAARAGSSGAFHLLVEMDENKTAIDSIRKAGFGVYGWQRIWQFRTPPHNPANGQSDPSIWQPATSLDEIAIRNLHQSLVPPLVQSAEPLTARRPHGWVYRQEGEILAYVEGVYGPRGIYLQPLIHPGVENVSQVVSALLAQQPKLLNRPVYIAIRSYQAWLETVVRDLECQVGPRQALMVKHLIVQQRSPALVARHSVLEQYKAEPTVPMVQQSSTHSE